jgi:pyrroline-5-carboxylate reductase
VKATVFLGGGRITSALVAGLRLARYRQPIIVHDRHPEKLYELEREYGVIAQPDLRRAIDSAALLIIAVRPQSVRELLRQLSDFKRLRLPAVSLAAGLPLSKLRADLGPPVRWARAMPSPVCRSGRGLTALTFARGFTLPERKKVRAIFSLVGAVLEIPEKQFDAFTVTYSSSHGYHTLGALIDAAEGIGLDRKTAQLASAHALADGIVAWREGDASLEELSQEAITPGGVAAAVIDALDSSGYHRAITRGLEAGMKQARKNGR